MTGEYHVATGGSPTDRRPRLLDLFCGAGGAAMGYSRAGFDVVGVDIKPQPHYPFEFHQGDAMTWPLDGFDAIHASPPCQFYSITRNLPWVDRSKHWDSVPPTLAGLQASGLPYVIENVIGAPLDGIMLCGQMFGMRRADGKPVYRHRLFESSTFLMAPSHPKHYEVIQAGHQTRGRLSGHGTDIGCEWMTKTERNQAIPPAYTEWIGAQLLRAIDRKEPAYV
jgi:DNA (cytosine-5)-methyltransferase 1